ncbi:hypothetical protein HDE_05950 [Halotydeus destructor]|nr:hypothetical protein HDE_05950 [Halotydeus destructor]
MRLKSGIMFERHTLLVLFLVTSGFVLLTNGAPFSDGKYANLCHAKVNDKVTKLMACWLETVNPKVIKVLKKCFASVNLTFPTTTQSVISNICKYETDKGYAKAVDKATDCASEPGNGIDWQAEKEKLEVNATDGQGFD